MVLKDDDPRWALGVPIPDNIMFILEKFAVFKSDWLRTRKRFYNGESIGDYQYHLNREGSNFIESWKNVDQTGKKQLIEDAHDRSHVFHNQWVAFWDNVVDYPIKATNLQKHVVDRLTNKLRDLVERFGDAETTPRLQSMEWNGYFDLVIGDEYKTELSEILNRAGYDDGTGKTASNLRFCMSTWNRFRNAYEHGKDNTTGININRKYLNKCSKIIDDIIYFEELDEDAFDDFFRKTLSFLSTLEPWEGISDPDMLEHHLTLIGDRQYALETRAKAISRKLNLQEWKEYFEPKIKLESGDEVLATEQIADLFQEHIVIQIHGRGGQGKTALVYEFIKKNIENYFEEVPRFESIVPLTSKSEEQGEWIAERFRITEEGPIANPRDPSQGMMMYIPGLAFDKFIARICALSEKPASGQEEALNILQKERHLVILDNYEDVSSEDKQSYKNFFTKLKKLLFSSNPVQSKLIITTRPNEELPFGKIFLQPLPTEVANRMLVARYRHYASNYGPPVWITDAKYLNALQDYISSESASENNILNKVRALLPDQGMQNRFTDSSSHPKILFNLVSLIGDAALRNKHKLDPTLSVEQYIAEIVQLPDSPFIEYHDQTYTWIIKKAYDDLFADECCKFILKELVHSRGGMDHNQLEAAAIENGLEVDFQDINQALTKLRLAGCFVDITKVDLQTIRYNLLPDAFKFLVSIGTIESQTQGEIDVHPTSQTKPVTDDLESINSIIAVIKQGVNSDNFSENLTTQIDKLWDNDRPRFRNRQRISIHTLNQGLAIIEASVNFPPDILEETRFSIEKLREEIRESGQAILNHTNPQSKVVDAKPSAVALLLIQLLRFETTRKEEVQTLIAISKTLAPNWVDIGGY